MSKREVEKQPLILLPPPSSAASALATGIHDRHASLACITGVDHGRCRDDFEVLEAVKAGKWEWPSHVSVSDSAKEFVAALLVVDPLERLTCEQALKHPWMQVCYGTVCTAVLVLLYGR